jgi:hypothetical protein
MAVYFAPERKKGGWEDFLPMVAQQLIGGWIGQMYDRDQKAREYKYGQRTANDEAARQEALKQQESARLQEFMASNPIDLRNPNDAFMKIAAMKMMFPNTYSDEMLKSFNPPMSFQQIQQGDRVTAGPFDPATGGFGGQEYGVNLSPDVARRTQADERVAGIRAGADRYVADRNAEAKMNPDQKNLGQHIQNLLKAREQYIDPYEKTPFPGSESVVAQIDAQIAAAMNFDQQAGAEPQVGTPPGAGGGPQPPAQTQALPNQESIWGKVFDNALSKSVYAPFMAPQNGTPAQTTQSGNPFAGRLDDAVYRNLKAAGRSDAEIEAELTQLGR